MTAVPEGTIRWVDAERVTRSMEGRGVNRGRQVVDVNHREGLRDRPCLVDTIQDALDRPTERPSNRPDSPLCITSRSAEHDGYLEEVWTSQSDCPRNGEKSDYRGATPILLCAYYSACVSNPALSSWVCVQLYCVELGLCPIPLCPFGYMTNPAVSIWVYTFNSTVSNVFGGSTTFFARPTFSRPNASTSNIANSICVQYCDVSSAKCPTRAGSIETMSNTNEVEFR